MGIKGLDKFIRENTNYTISHKKMNDIYGKTVIIDTSCLIYRYVLHNEYMFMNIFKGIIKKFKKYKIKPIFVFDGISPNEKQKTILKRTEKKKSALIELARLENDLKDLHSEEGSLNNITEKYILHSKEKNSKDTIEQVIDKKIIKAQKKSMHFKSSYVKQIKTYLDSTKISYIHTKIEADLVCAFFVISEIADYCISDDTDMFTYKCNYVIRNIDFHNEKIDIYNRQNLLKELNIDENQFLDLCILLGSDYIPRTIGIKPTNILYLIHKYYSIENIIYNINFINNEKHIKKTIYMNQISKYLSVRQIFNETIDFSSIITDSNIYCTSIKQQLQTHI
jgi:flap endonuclease-1